MYIVWSVLVYCELLWGLTACGGARDTPSDDPVVKVALKLVEDSVQNGIEVLLFFHPASRL